MEIKSDFTQIACGVTPSFYACGNHKVILSGTESQKITMEEPNSCFNVLELKNTSEEGVSFLTQVAFLEGIITNNVPTNFSRKGALGWTLSSNEEINGDFYLVGGTLDLNGYKLKINGNLIHSGGTIVLNGGQLTVNGDYRIQTELENKDKDGKTVYDQSYGVLKMTNPEDYILVMGDFVMQNYYQTKDSKVLSDGVLEIKGDFTQIACGVTPSFYACENHKVILSGTKLQRITMEETYSRFNILELKNTSEEGVVFLTPISEWKLESDQVVSGDVVVGARTIDLNGHTLRIKGDLIHPQGTLFINGGKLIVEGDYRIQTKSVDGEGNALYKESYGVLKMTNPKDHVLVMGDFVMQNY